MSNGSPKWFLGVVSNSRGVSMKCVFWEETSKLTKRSYATPLVAITLKPEQLIDTELSNSYYKHS